MSKTAKKIDPVLIMKMKERIKDPEYIQVAVASIAGIISTKIFFETQR